MPPVPGLPRRSTLSASALSVVCLVLCALLPAASARAGAPDSVSLPPAPAAQLPLVVGQNNAIQFTVNVNLSSQSSAPLTLVGQLEGAGALVALGGDTTAQRGSTQVTLSGSYTPDSSGARWLAVQAVLGPIDAPLAMSSPVPFMLMNLTSGAHADAYWTPSLDPALAQAYVSDFDSIWRQVGAIFNSYADQRQVILLTADHDTFEQTLLSLGYSAADAADREEAAEGDQISALNHQGVIIIDVPNTGGQADPLTLAHEYSETRYLALQPGNQGAGWFWDGLADTIAARLAPSLSGAGCEADAKATNYWRTAMTAIADGTYLPLAQITTQDQWIANYNDDALQYAEGYTAVQYWQERFGFDALVQFVEQPKSQPSDFEGALESVLGMTQAQFEDAYLGAMQADLSEPPLAIPITVHLDPSGIGPDSFIYLTSAFSAGQGTTYRTRTGLQAGDYHLEFESDGSVVSTDGRVTLSAAPYSVPPGQEGLIYAGIADPAYTGQAGLPGREVLRLSDLYGRAGLSRQYYFVTATSSAEPTPGDCQQPWPDGNQITASLPPGADAAP